MPLPSGEGGVPEGMLESAQSTSTRQLMPGALARRASVVSSEVAPIISVRAT